MTEKRKYSITEAVDQFLISTTQGSPSMSLSGNVPQALKVILKEISRDLLLKAPDREYTAMQIRVIAHTVFTGRNETPPEILGNIRAFGRYMQKYPDVTGFKISGSTGNRRTYKPHGASVHKQHPLDS